MSESKTQNVWRECEENNSRIAYTITLTALGVIPLVGTALGFLTNLGWFYSFLIGLYVVLLPLIGYQLVTWLLELQKPRGQILWDFGTRSGRAAMIVLATLVMFLHTVLLVAVLRSRDPAPQEYFTPLSGLLVFGILSLNHAGRLQICSVGIWGYRKLLPWDELEFFEWKSAGDWKKSALWLKHQHPRFGPVKQVLVFPDEDKEQVEEFLRLHLLPISDEVETKADAETETQPV